MAHGIEGCRVYFIFFRINAVCRQPLVEMNVAQDLCKIWANAGQQYGNTAFLRVAEELFEVLNCHHVWVAGAS